MSAIDPLGAALIARARNAVRSEFRLPAIPEPGHPRLEAEGATFVTLFAGGALRGCVGSLDAVRTLDDDVRSNAWAAAFRDPRFRPLTAPEFSATRFEVSLLGGASPLPGATEDEVVAALVPYRDGVTLRWHDLRATLLPQVWDSLPDPRHFLRALKHKAGLEPGFWSPSIRLERYSVTHFDETPRALA
jgi:AmmeMemoRadiSam system protein A